MRTVSPARAPPPSFASSAATSASLSESSFTTAIGVPTATVWPCCTRIFASVPAT
jgi:hypothetical protein